MKWILRDKEMIEKRELLTRVNMAIKQGAGTLVICEVCDSHDTQLVKNKLDYLRRLKANIEEAIKKEEE